MGRRGCAGWAVKVGEVVKSPVGSPEGAGEYPMMADDLVCDSWAVVGWGRLYVQD